MYITSKILPDLSSRLMPSYSHFVTFDLIFRDNLLNVHGVRQLGKPLTGLRILDVGCGGGLLSEVTSVNYENYAVIT